MATTFSSLIRESTTRGARKLSACLKACRARDLGEELRNDSVRSSRTRPSATLRASWINRACRLGHYEHPRKSLRTVQFLGDDGRQLNPRKAELEASVSRNEKIAPIRDRSAGRSPRSILCGIPTGLKHITSVCTRIPDLPRKSGEISMMQEDLLNPPRVFAPIPSRSIVSVPGRAFVPSADSDPEDRRPFLGRNAFVPALAPSQ